MDEINQLAGQAAALDAEIAAASLPPPDPSAQPAAVPVDTLSEARDLILFAVALFTPLYPSIPAVYTMDRQEKLAKVSAPLMEKYGITMSGLFEKWGVELNFLIVAAPLALDTAKAMKADNEARKAAADAAKNQQPAE